MNELDFEIEFHDFISRHFWIEKFNYLNIENNEFISSAKHFQINQKFEQEINDRMITEGYFQIEPPDWEMDFEIMSNIISILVNNNMPAVMAFLFDEFWIIFIKLNKIAEVILGKGYLRLPDFWAWHVDPKKKQSGWAPHRDKGYLSLNEDRSPKSITFWIPLSTSTPLNGCMYIVPANKDRTYGTELDSKWNFELSSIRALPALPGTIFCWNQAVLHWGSECSERTISPRISVAFEFQSGNVDPFNEPLMDPLTVPRFELRLKLISKQLLQYQHMYPLSKRMQSISMKILESK